MAARVLVVEDDEATRSALRALLDDAGYECDEAPDGEGAVAAMRDDRFDLVLLDLGLPGMWGGGRPPPRRSSASAPTPTIRSRARSSRPARKTSSPSHTTLKSSSRALERRYGA